MISSKGNSKILCFMLNNVDNDHRLLPEKRRLYSPTFAIVIQLSLSSLARARKRRLKLAKMPSIAVEK